MNEGERHLVEWQRGGLCGSFYTGLFEAIGKADDEHQARLYESFPEHVAAFRKYRSVSGYWPELQERYDGLRA